MSQDRGTMARASLKLHPRNYVSQAGYPGFWVTVSCWGLKTEWFLESVQPAIELQQVRFSGTLEFDSNSTLISTYWDREAPRYTGEPSEELDARWHALIHRKWTSEGIIRL